MTSPMTAADDELHPPPDDDPFWTETLWLGFAVPDRDLTGVTYSIMRPNQHIASLGVYLWDDIGRLEPDALYFHARGHLPMPASLRSMDLPGFTHRCVEPLRAYEVTYDDGVELAVQLRYDALHEPIGRGFGEAAAGYSQPCRVTGTLRLNGETVPVDCCELRASAWTHRSDDRPAPLAPDLDPIPGYSDTYGYSDDVSFFVGTAGTQTLTHSHGGYLLRDGDLQPLTEAERTVVRRSPDGYPEDSSSRRRMRPGGRSTPGGAASTTSVSPCPATRSRPTDPAGTSTARPCGVRTTTWPAAVRLAT